MLIDHETLRRVTRAILAAGGSPPSEAKIVADHLVEAHLKGHPSHGVGMIPRYFEALHRDELRPNKTVSIVTDSGPLLIVDGNRVSVLGSGDFFGEQSLLAMKKAAAQIEAVSFCELYRLRREDFIALKLNFKDTFNGFAQAGETAREKALFQEMLLLLSSPGE